MRILIATSIFPPDIGGPATYSKKLADFLVEKGWNVTVLTYCSSSLLKGSNQKNKYRLVRVSNSWPLFLRQLIYLIKVIICSRKSDLIYAQTILSSGIPVLMASFLWRKKYIVKVVGDSVWERAMVHGRIALSIEEFQNISGGPLSFLFKKLQNLTVKNAAKVIVPSQYLKSIVSGWGVHKDRVHIIYNGADFQKSKLSQTEAKQKIGTFGSVIISVGRLVPWKGFKMLIKVFKEILEVDPYLNLFIIGDGPEKELLDLYIKNMRLRNKVYLVGKKSRTELADYLAAADLFVLNTSYEGFSHQIIEAMSAEVPIITTRVGGNTEIIQSGFNGFLVDYNEADQLSRAILDLYKNKKCKKIFIQNGLVTAAVFSEFKMLKETENLLTKL